jgi:hypothetical protein
MQSSAYRRARAANGPLQAFEKNVRSKGSFSHLQRRSLQAIVRIEPSLTGGTHFDLLWYVGHVRPE